MGFRPLVVLLGLGVLAAACGAPAAPAGQTQSQKSPPKYGGTLNLASVTDPFDYDLTLNGISAPNPDYFFMSLYSLVSFRAAPEVAFADEVMEPSLAESWEINKDATVYTFHLRKGVRFSDLPPVNGREFTSKDVKFTYEYYSRSGEFKDKKPASPVAWTYEGIQTIETPDAYTAVVKFSEPRASFRGITAANRWSAIVPREIYDRDGDFKNALAGTGPYVIDQAASQKGSRWVYKKNPKYFQPERPYIDEVRWLILADDSATRAVFQTRQVDMFGYGTSGFTVEQADSIKASNPNAVAYKFNAPAPLQLMFNTKKQPLDDLRVRKAMALAINRDEYLQVFGKGQGQWALTPALLGAFSEQEIKQIIKYDPEEARRLLVESGHAGGVNLEFMYTAERGGRYMKEMELLISQLKKANINLTAKGTDKASDTRRKITGDYEISLVPSARTAGDVMDWAVAHFLPGSSSNFNQLDDLRVTAMLKAGESEPDLKKRTEIVRQIARYAYDNVLAISIYHGVDHAFWHPYVKNFTPNFWTRGVPIVNTWLEK